MNVKKSGEQHRFRRYTVRRLVTGSAKAFLERYKDFDHANHLLITHASREDIFMAMVGVQHDIERSKGGHIDFGLSIIN